MATLTTFVQARGRSVWWSRVKGIVVTAAVLGLLGLPFGVGAQGGELGLNEFAQNTNLGTNLELISTIARVINIALGFLGVIAIALILYAGWLWMTSRGEAEKIAKAKKIMLGAVIGLAIILSAFAIASFIIKQIQGSTGGPGGPGVCWDGNPPPCPPRTFGTSYLQVRSQAPLGNNVKLCTSVQVSFSEAVQWSTVSTNFIIQEATTNTPFTSGTYQPGSDSSNISFTHFGNEFAPNTTYRATLSSGAGGLRSVSDLNLRTDKVWTFTTGTESDDTAPTVEATQPPAGGVEVCRATPIQVVFSEPMLSTSFANNVLLQDEAGNNIQLSAPTFGDGYRIVNFTIQQELAAFTTYRVTLNGEVGGITDTCGIPLASDYTWTFETGETTDCSPSISSVAPNRRDYGQVTTVTGSNLFLDGEFYINNFPADSNSFPGATPPENVLCWGGVSRDGSTSCTGSQIKVRTPVGATTGPAYDQSGLTASAGEVYVAIGSANSNTLPFTVTSPYLEWLSPSSGGPGQYITLSGWNFGGAAGQVRFVRADGTWVAGEPPEACGNWWGETEIVVKVPTTLVAGVSYQVEVVTAASGSNGGNKRSNSESFLVTSQPPGPGLCMLEPSTSPFLNLPIMVTATGERFGDNQGGSVLTFDNANNLNASSYTSWSEGEIIAQTPVANGQNALSDGNWRVQVKVNSQLSNSKSFTVIADTTAYPRVVETASCSAATQSPSPYKDSTDACGNAEVSARFTLPMDPTTLTVGSAGNIKVEECGNGASLGPCTISLSFNPTTYLYNAQNNVIGFSAPPRTPFQDGYWYQGTITPGVTSVTGAPLQSPYVWRFKVASLLCPISSVLLTPSYATIRELVPDPGSSQVFSSTATAANCNNINPADYTWRWTVANHPSDPPPPARLQFEGGGSQLPNGSTSVTVEALDYTPTSKPARVAVEAVGQNKQDTSDVQVSGTFCTELNDCNACGTGTSSCIAGSCEPVVSGLSPQDGAPGTWLTISGCYFGTTRGRVTYVASGGSTADGLWPNPAVCGPSTWSNTQIVSEVPNRAVTGGVTIERAPPQGGSSISSTPFTVNNVNRPGLCRLAPLSHYEADLGTPAATITIDGRGFGNIRVTAWLWRGLVRAVRTAWAQGVLDPLSDNVNYYRFISGTPTYWGSATSYPAWSGISVQAITPTFPVVLQAAELNKVSINKQGIESNRLNYTIRPGSGGGGVGEQCDADPSPQCNPDDTLCASGLFCDAARSCTCQPIGGSLPKIVSVEPAPNATNICRNAVLVITFDKNVSSSTILPSQLELLRGGCAGAALPPSKWKQRLAKWLLFISPVDAETWCDRRLGRIQASGNTITFIPDSPLKADRQHRVVISSPNVDCANSNGLCQWQFRTGADICQIDLVMVYPPNRLFTAAGQTQELLAQARSAEGQPLAADYSWEEDDSADVVAVTSPLNNQIINVTANNRSGEASMITTANGSNYGNSGEKSASATLTVFLCEVPWTTSDTDYDFRLMYCRGQTGSPDLLPELLVSGNDRNPATNNGLMREYFFKHPTLDEAIGLRIYRNSDHLSPQAWYATRGDITLGAPSPFTVDGYQAVRDAQTAYVGAVAKLSSNLYTNMYVLSFSQGASAETVSIFNQLVNQWLFNSDLMSQEQAKLQHDLIRLQDLAGLASKLSTYAAAHGGRYPKLPAGTFLVGQSTSVWSSWQAELGNELGQALPVDPTNTFNDCPSGYDPTTCWRASTKSFVCPAGSHVYQYKVASNSYGYTLYTNPEFKNVTWQGTTPVTITSNDACDSYTVTKVGNPLLSAEDAQ